MPTTIEYLPRFDRRLERLERKYPRTYFAVDRLIIQLEQGLRPGQLIPNVGYTLYKVRLPNRAARRGKRGGFRVIYYAQFHDRVTLLAIYSKSDEADISIAELRQLASEAEQ